MSVISGPEYAKVVFESRDGGTLWTASKIRAMCQLEEDAIRSHESFESSCVRTSREPHRCCRSWSTGNYVALLSNKSSCFDVVDRDATRVRRLLQRCFSSFRANLHLASSVGTPKTATKRLLVGAAAVRFRGSADGPKRPSIICCTTSQIETSPTAAMDRLRNRTSMSPVFYRYQPESTPSGCISTWRRWKSSTTA